MSKMTKGASAALALIFPILFNLIFFIVPFPKSAATWVSYGFIHLAYILLLLGMFYFANAGGKQYRDTASLALTMGRYFWIELVLGVIIIAGNAVLKLVLNWEIPGWLAFLVQIIVLGLYFGLALFQFTADQHDREVNAVRAQERQYILTCAEMVKSQVGRGPSPKANKAIQMVYDKLRTSPRASVPGAKSIEAQIEAKTGELRMAGSEEQIMQVTDELLRMIEERNAILRINQ